MPTQQTERAYERIDGREYICGSREHTDALKRAVARTQRQLMESDCIADRIEAPGTAFLARDLVDVSREIQKTLYDRLRAKDLIPITSRIAPGAEAWTYRQHSEVGS